MLSQSICHSLTTDHLLNKDLTQRVLIIGASNFVGHSLTKEAGTSFLKGGIFPAEEDTPIFVDPISWYRWERLVHEGYNPQFVNFSDYHSTQEIMKQVAPSIVIYVPTLVFERSLMPSLTASKLSSSYKSFLMLLQVIKDYYLPVHVSLLSLDHQWNRWMKSFELALSSYSWLYNIKISVFRVKHVFGFLSSEKLGSLKKSCFINDLAGTILTLIVDQSATCRVYDMTECSHDIRNENTNEDENVRSEAQVAYQMYLRRQTRDVVMTTYFTTQKNPQYKVDFMNNNFYFMENWFYSAYKLGLHMVIFHDDLSKSFIETFTKNCPNIEFIKVNNFNGYTPNDWRYFLYYEYILSNSDVRYALMTDLRDIKFITNPFKMMDVVGDFVYIGIDVPFHESSLSSKVVKGLEKCYSFYPKDILGLYGNLNPGVLGGRRVTILSALSKYMQFIRSSTKLNCNTPAASYLFHAIFYKSLFFGWPLQTGFMTDQPHPPGLSVIHKWNEESWS